MSRDNRKVIELLTEALSIVQEPESESPIKALTDITPVGVKLHVSKASDGTWWYYLTMPHGWYPPEGGKRWLQNSTNYRFWDTGTGVEWVSPQLREGPTNTKQDALKGGLLRLLGVL